MTTLRRTSSTMPSLTHWLQRLVDEVLGAVPVSAAAFVSAPVEQPEPATGVSAVESVVGPIPAVPPRLSRTDFRCRHVNDFGFSNRTADLIAQIA